jgi:hypothetical protein
MGSGEIEIDRPWNAFIGLLNREGQFGFSFLRIKKFGKYLVYDLVLGLSRVFYKLEVKAHDPAVGV